MKTLLHIVLISLCTFATTVNASDKKSLVYINKNIGFNVEGYKYQQAALPCDVDNMLVEFLIKRSEKSNITMEAVEFLIPQNEKSNITMEVVETKEKISNSTIPVVLIDIEKLSLGKNQRYGIETNNSLPRIQITAAILKGKELTTAKHTCAIASSIEFILPTDKILVNPQPNHMCVPMNKCLKDLSKDVVEWLEPQI